MPSLLIRTIMTAMLTTWFMACSSPVQVNETDSSRYKNDPGAPEATSLLGRRLYATPPAGDRARQTAALREAEAVLRDRPEDPASWIWVGRRLGYLWRMTEAIEVYSRGIERHPKDAALHRHRGHRYITVRQFDRAIADLQSASRLMSGQPDVVEQDGLPNEKNIPLTTLHFNVWYHLGVAHFLKGDFPAARSAFDEAMRCRGAYDDNLVAVTDWLYMCLRRMGRDDEAAAILEPIRGDMEIIENHAYHRRLLMYKGQMQIEELLDVESASDLDFATMGFGVGHWHLCEGDRVRAAAIFDKVVAGGYWPAFGHIAAEAELARMRRK